MGAERPGAGRNQDGGANLAQRQSPVLTPGAGDLARGHVQAIEDVGYSDHEQ